ncbi:MAG: N-acetyltransferase [Rhodobacteraceae bacterium]|nr:N-acetyltransferase [Paracoccaceae bacterium]MCY4139168.1 N-acetyltransferase [Paracoccaceae bacterium]
MAGFQLRLETDRDRDGIEELLLAAFPTALEAHLVQMLREDDDVVYSLVASERTGVVGHALFSRMPAPAGTLALGPVAVTAPRRRQGIAAALIRAGLEHAKADAWEAAIVLGDPSYYRRFGFSREAVRRMSCRYAGPNLMGLALTRTAFSGSHIEYAPAFTKVEDSP